MIELHNSLRRAKKIFLNCPGLYFQCLDAMKEHYGILLHENFSNTGCISFLPITRMASSVLKDLRSRKLSSSH